MDNPWIFVSIAACLVACGWIVAYMFERKNRSPALGFALGLFLAWVGILIAMFLGPGRNFSGAKSRLWWFLPPIVALVAISIALASRAESRLSLPREVLPDGRILIGNATFSEVKAGFGGSAADGVMCSVGGYPYASAKVACAASSSAPCEYLVGMEFKTETGRLFGDDAKPNSISVPPGQEVPVTLLWSGDGCYSREHAAAVYLSVREAGPEGRRTRITVGLTK